MAVTLNANTSTGFIATSDTSGVLQLQTGGTAAVTVDASQNVGIGTVSPSFVSGYGGVQINGGSNGSVLRLTNSTTGTTSADGFDLILGQGSSDAYVWQRESAPLVFGTASTERMRIDSSGNVGIGTTSPATTLHLNGATSGAAKLRVGRSTSDTNFIQLQMNGGDSVIVANGVTGTNGSLLFGRDANTGTFTESARFDASGQFLIGTTTSNSNYGLRISGNRGIELVGWGNARGEAMNLTAHNTSNADVIYFNTSAAQVGRISITSSATSYVTSSDYRLKENIAPMTGALEKVALLKPCTYKWKTDGSDGQGFIAHELQVVAPDCVVGEKDAVDADGNPKYQGVDTSFLVATLTAAIQEQQAIIQTLTDRITALEGTTP